MYKYTDKVIDYLIEKCIWLFGKAKRLTSFDEINVLDHSYTLYNELERLALESFVVLAQQVYEETVEYAATVIDEAWVVDILNRYDPVTKYVYISKIDRKRSRFAESVIASSTKSSEVDVAMRLWSNMISQYAITITDEARKQAYVDNGVEKVVWVSVKDSKRCKECEKRHGKVYAIDEIPPKPHIGCRCYLLPYEEV